MAATRKLQGEIDRCLKKVAEGVETFEDIWKKVHNATNSNQKEKYEADLKKEIKKLQRLRDQIKSWIASAEIKDKSSLLENRRLIETQMERFKIVERETKTKAYSKEGLGAAQKMDPAQRIKDEARNWLTNSISSLQLQIDQYESEIESLLAGKKKRLDRDKQDRMDELRSKLDRHKFHITKLETLLRLLDNDGVEAEQVNKIKDDVEYYIDSSQDPDFEENEFIYDDIIGLDEVELSGTGVSLGIPSSATTDSNNSNETSGSPSSITSGVSPASSPQPLQQQQHHVINSQQQQQIQHQQQQMQQGQQGTLNTSGNMAINYNQDSISLDGSGNGSTILPIVDKRKIESALMNNKQPVKPTPVRAVINNKTPTSTTIEAPLNKISNTTPSKLHYQQQQQQQQQQQAQQQQHQQLTSTVNQQQASNTLGSSLPSAQQQAQQQQQQQQQLQGTQMSNMNVLSTGTSASNTSIHGQSVIQATPTIAFAAVAKNSTSHLENGGAVSTANNFVGMSGNSNVTQQQQQQQHTQQQQTHLPNLPTNATHLQNGLSDAINSIQNNAVDAISLKTMAQEAINRTSLMNAVNLSQQQPHDTRPQQQQQQQQQQSNVHYTTNTDKTSTNINNQLQQQQTQQQQQQQQQQNSTAISGASVGSVEITQNGSTTTTIAPAAAATATNLQQQQQQVATVGNLLNAANTNSHSQQQQQQQQQQSGSSLSNPTTSTPTSSSNLLVGRQLQNPTNEAHIPPLLGVAPLGPHPLGKDHQFQFQMMESAFYHLPQPIDSEKMTTYFHRTPVQTPSYYPQSPLPIYDTVEFYQRLSTETLFFVFYYMEGSKAQYLAAKALKKQSWRFHTKYMMWFQRHEEPKIINDDYEQGTYIYFDYEKWSQRKKEGFTFEYKYLEDKELN